MKILILGVTGMLGNAFFRYFCAKPGYQVVGTLRNDTGRQYFPAQYHSNLLAGINVLENDALVEIFSQVCPDVVINCIGLIKQLAISNDPVHALPINALLPHRLNRLCVLANSRLVHFSTDCVFAGDKGMYRESDTSDAMDLYGKSKYIGEIHDSSSAITLRTSIIGHELNSNHALIDWFLSQEGPVKGYRNAVFSGLPTVELARIVDEYVLPDQSLAGLYHVSAEPIDKLSLLQLVAKEYDKNIEIIPDNAVCIDRSLDSTMFRNKTGYVPPDWVSLVRYMHESRL